MVRPKKNEPGHERASRRWRRTMEERYGGKEGLHRKMQEMGASGGRAGHTGGFYNNSEGAKAAGSKGGKLSRRGFTYLGKKDGRRIYQNNKNGDIEVI